jgi:hypothetical protein
MQNNAKVSKIREFSIRLESPSGSSLTRSVFVRSRTWKEGASKLRRALSEGLIDIESIHGASFSSKWCSYTFRPMYRMISKDLLSYLSAWAESDDWELKWFSEKKDDSQRPSLKGGTKK